MPSRCGRDRRHGCEPDQTTLRVVLPAALSGVAAAVVLGLSRAVGETMIVTLAAGSQKNLASTRERACRR